MQVESISVELRPRPMWEAGDLGVRLVQAHARSVWWTFGPLFAVVLVVSVATMEIAPWLPSLLLFWLKPWLDRSVLFVLSRAVFGQDTRFGDLWRAKGSVWGGQWLSTLLWRRFSPWRAFTQPIYQLEGQRGSARRQRRTQLLRSQRGAAWGMQFAYANAELALTMGLISLAVWFAPDPQRGGVMSALFEGDGLSYWLPTTLVYGVVILLLEPFYVASGFAMYLNRRVQLEAWDVEQEFRRAF